jgi:hypothetical protein
MSAVGPVQAGKGTIVEGRLSKGGEGVEVRCDGSERRANGWSGNGSVVDGVGSKVEEGE